MADRLSGHTAVALPRMTEMTFARRRREQVRFIWALVLITGGIRTGVEVAIFYLHPDYQHSLPTQLVTVWPVALLIGYVGARMFRSLSKHLDEHEAARLDALGRVEYLEATNALLHSLASAPNVTQTFETLASHICDVVPCDRVALALPSETGDEFQLFIGRLPDEAGSVADGPRVHHFMSAGTLTQDVMTTGRPRIVPDLSEIVSASLDANVLGSAGLSSAVVVPLVCEHRAVGTLTLLARRPQAFLPAHLEALRPISDIVAVAFATQNLSRALGRHQAAKAMSELTFSFVNDINGAMQAIVGRCELLTRQHTDPALRHDLAAITAQASRVTEVLSHLHEVAEERLRVEDAAAMVSAVQAVPDIPRT